MIDKLKSLLKSDDLLPTLSVFPEIDDEKIKLDLKLESLGSSRGQQNQPAPLTVQADHVESAIIKRIGDLRKKGLENYENNRQIYNERLLRASNLRKEVEIVAGNAKGDYLTAVRGWKAQMTSTTERLYETFQARKDFRERHGLHRPAKHFEGWILFISITIIFIGIESSLNAFMFSRGNEQGLLGGLLTAVIFSAVNVILSILLGMGSCGLNHRYLFRRVTGLACLGSWIAFAAALNLTVAHFRDLIDAEVDWARAVQSAIPKLKVDPLGLASMDSWFLLAVGGIISLLAFIKGWHAFDPFPGYSHVEMDLARARDAHAHHFEDAIGELTDKRDTAIEELRDADFQVRDGISQAIDALYGHSALNSHLQTFLDECDAKIAYLLAVYRDANVSARNEPAPPSFQNSHTFPAFRADIRDDDSHRVTAEAEAEKVRTAVEDAIAGIFRSFEAAVTEFQLPDDVQRGNVAATKLMPEPDTLPAGEAKA